MSSGKQFSCSCFLTGPCCVSPQKSSGEVTLKDCLRLFTKEDVLDGEERPVRSLTLHTTLHISFCKDDVWIIQQLYLTAVSAFFLSLRHATDAKPEGNAPKDSAFRSSLRSSCFVSFSHIFAPLVSRFQHADAFK